MDNPPAVYGIIPARYGSSRFPGKPLTPILQRPMFWHVFSRASQCPQLAGVYLATDDERIRRAAEALDIPAVMTDPGHPSGTDRIFEAAQRLKLPGDSVVVNIQGDEPALAPEMLSLVVEPFSDQRVRVSTLASPVSEREAADPNLVKVAISGQGWALYFSRCAIPYHRSEGERRYMGHIGLYAYRLDDLQRFVALGPSRLELTEKLEQLRFLEAGIPIRVASCYHRTTGVDSPEDVPRVEAILRQEQE
jgi:3-deoxy-manno-octulosonate cytidylyltransferase (CMP-KDO synthetase)